MEIDKYTIVDVENDIKYQDIRKKAIILHTAATITAVLLVISVIPGVFFWNFSSEMSILLGLAAVIITILGLIFSLSTEEKLEERASEIASKKKNKEESAF